MKSFVKGCLRTCGWSQQRLDHLRWGLGHRGRLVRNRLRNRHKGERCFVIGNGPSLRSIDLRLLKNEITIGCNGLFLMFDEMGFVPTYYTVEDRLVAEDRAVEINNIRGTCKVFPQDLATLLRADDDTVYVNFVRGYQGFPKFSADFDFCVYWGGTVTYMNLELAWYLGCREVYLVGIDHNYKIFGKIQGELITSDQDDVNHFHPDYFGRGYRWSDPKVERMEEAYICSKHFYESHGGRIYNATAGGKLEVFPRVDFQDLFKGGR